MEKKLKRKMYIQECDVMLGRGATLCFIYKDILLDETFVEDFFKKANEITLLGESTFYKFESEKFIDDTNIDGITNKKKFLDGSLCRIIYKDGVLKREVLIDPLNAINAPKLLKDQQWKILSFTSMEKRIPLNDSRVVNNFFDTCLELANPFKPIYAWGDSWKRIVKQETNNPWNFIWGVNYWNSDFGNRFVLDGLSNINEKDWKVTKNEYGGTMLRAIPNPLKVNSRKTSSVEKILLLQQRENYENQKDKKIDAESNYW